MLKLIVKDIADVWVRKLAQDVQNYINKSPLMLAEFRFIEIAETSATAVTNGVKPHNLGTVPTDVIILSSIGTGVLTFSYDLFTKDSIIYSTTGPVTVRALIGRYPN